MTAWRQKFSSRHYVNIAKRAHSPVLLRAPPKRLPLYERLRGYQKKAVSFALTRVGAGLFCDPRTGKTWMALAYIEQLLAEGANDFLCVVPLTNKLTTWARLVRELMPELNLCLSYDEFKKAPKPRILLHHYEELHLVIRKLIKVPWSSVILDEAQRIKERNSHQSRHLRRLRHVERRLALSGTPIDSSEIDLWGQMRFIEPTALSERWADFDRTFLEPTGFMGYGREFKEEMSDDFYRLVKPYCYRVTREDAGIPEPRLVWCPTLMLGKQRRRYERLERDWMLTMGGVRIKTEMEMVKRTKLQQVANGFIFDEDKNVYATGQAKLRKLRHLLSKKIKPPAIIFFQYLPEAELIEKLCLEFSPRVAKLTGQVKDTKANKRRSDLILSFQRGEIDYLITQERTGGVGIDLFRARNAAFYSFDESWINFEQAKSRMDFPGMSTPTIFLIIASDTIDEAKKDAILQKRDLSEVVLENLRRHK